MPRFQANFYLYAENLNRAIAFYTENFKFKLLGHIEDKNTESWGALKIENSILWLGQQGAKSGLIILIDSEIEKFVSQLIEMNVEFFIPENIKFNTRENDYVLNTEWGKHAWFLDSEKNRIMLFQPLE